MVVHETAVEAAVVADRELLGRVADGDEEAFEVLVERYQGRLLALCERYLGDREEAQDATQEVLVKVYRKAGTYRPRGQVSTWLYRIAVNHCLNRLRRRRIVRFLPFADPGEESSGGVTDEPRDPAPDAAARLVARERWQRTRRLIDALPPSQRSVLILARFEGLSYREIAAVLGITVGAVESRLFRAMRRLEKAQEEAGSGVSDNEAREDP